MFNSDSNLTKKPTKEEAEKAVGTLLRYIGGDANREGLADTPRRVIKSYQEIFAGYDADIKNILNKRFYDISDFNDIVLLKSISFSSMCEHHLLPFSGTADVAYIPNGFVLGISKIVRLVDAYAKRLQMQERITSSVANTLQNHLKPKGVAIRISATHSCMKSRGVTKETSIMDTTYFTGIFKDCFNYRNEFFLEN